MMMSASKCGMMMSTSKCKIRVCFPKSCHWVRIACFNKAAEGFRRKIMQSACLSTETYICIHTNVQNPRCTNLSVSTKNVVRVSSVVEGPMPNVNSVFHCGAFELMMTGVLNSCPLIHGGCINQQVLANHGHMHVQAHT